MPTIASLIRQKLQNSPNGATTQEIATYCLMNGARFNSQDINKSVSAQLSKMNIYHIDIGGYYVWSLYPKSYYTKRDTLSQNIITPEINITQETNLNCDDVIQPKEFKEVDVAKNECNSDVWQPRNKHRNFIIIVFIIIAVLFLISLLLYETSYSKIEYELARSVYEDYVKMGLEYEKPFFLKYYFEPSFAFLKIFSVISIIIIVFSVIQYFNDN